MIATLKKIENTFLSSRTKAPCIQGGCPKILNTLASVFCSLFFDPRNSRIAAHAQYHNIAGSPRSASTGAEKITDISIGGIKSCTKICNFAFIAPESLHIIEVHIMRCMFGHLSGIFKSHSTAPCLADTHLVLF